MLQIGVEGSKLGEGTQTDNSICPGKGRSPVAEIGMGKCDFREGGQTAGAV